jgi:RND family efflux transporter MFP subunit
MNDLVAEADTKSEADTKVKRDVDDRTRQRRWRRTGRLLAVVVVAGLAGVVGFGVWSHAQRHAAAVATLKQKLDAIPTVRTMTARAVEGPLSFELPANLQAFNSATIYARATGYIEKWIIDYGAKVHKGQLLAAISAPDLDQQLAQARAQLVQMQAALVQAQANVQVAQANAWRSAKTAKDGWTPQQQADVDRFTLASQVAAVGVAVANLKAQQAQVDRYEQLTSFEQVVAPFDGLITSRQIDVGSLVSANENSGTPLYTIDRTDILRVQVYVPQEYYFAVHLEDDATLTLPQLPGRAFHGRVTRTATSLQPGTRTLLTEVDIDNKDGTLTAGLYGLVHFAVPRSHPVVTIPSEAVIFNEHGLQAAVVQNGRVQLRDLDVADDNGATLEIRDGLQPGDQVILSPPVDATNGMQVRATQGFGEQTTMLSASAAARG